MSDHVVVFSDQAKRHLRSIERYIAKKASPNDAAGFIRRIVRRCDRIALVPLQGERLDHLRAGLRKTGMEGSVAIIFRVDKSVITILSIAYGGRRFEKDFQKH